jgi:hypothetical protein
VDEVAVLCAQLVAVEARAGALGALLAQIVTAAPGLVELVPKHEMFSVCASPTPSSSQTPSASASTGTRSRSSSVLSSSQESKRSTASLGLMVCENRRSSVDGGADVTRHSSSSARCRRYGTCREP